MLSKNKIKFIQSLSSTKNRTKFGLFIAEGEKMIQQLLSADFAIEYIICTERTKALFKNLNTEVILAESNEIKKISSLRTPQDCLAICRIPDSTIIPNEITDELVLALDGIQDPGNMGTIIRIASWFGIKKIICSKNTVSCYNPKVVQATMGALAHVKLCYLDLEEFILKSKLNDINVYGTFLDGKNLYESELKPTGIIIMGNEGNGISNSIENMVDHKLLIPSYSVEENVESLNVGVATSLICAEFRRRL